MIQFYNSNLKPVKLGSVYYLDYSEASLIRTPLYLDYSPIRTHGSYDYIHVYKSDRLSVYSVIQTISFGTEMSG